MLSKGHIGSCVNHTSCYFGDKTVGYITGMNLSFYISIKTGLHGPKNSAETIKSQDDCMFSRHGNSFAAINRLRNS